MDYYYIKIMVLSCSLSALFSFFLLLTRQMHLNYSQDLDIGPQKIHENITPRIGGLCIATTFFFISFFIRSDLSNIFYFILISVFPIFMAGLLEDLTKKISAKIRLSFTLIAALTCIFFTNLSISSLGIDIINNFIKDTYFPYIIAFISIILLTQSFNIIDGLHGLCLLNASLILISIIYISSLTDDNFSFMLASIYLSTILGLLFFNFPLGKLFLGDGGAYLLGFVVAFLLIILSERNNIISPFCSLLLVIYPIYETLRSFFRRIISKSTSFLKPDNLHLHSLIYGCIRSKMNFKKEWAYNSFSSLITLMFPLMNCIWSVIYYDEQTFLIIGIILHIMLFEFSLLILNIFKNK